MARGCWQEWQLETGHVLVALESSFGSPRLLNATVWRSSHRLQSWLHVQLKLAVLLELRSAKQPCGFVTANVPRSLVAFAATLRNARGSSSTTDTLLKCTPPIGACRSLCRSATILMVGHPRPADPYAVRGPSCRSETSTSTSIAGTLNCKPGFFVLVICPPVQEIRDPTGAAPDLRQVWALNPLPQPAPSTVQSSKATSNGLEAFERPEKETVNPPPRYTDYTQSYWLHYCSRALLQCCGERVDNDTHRSCPVRCSCGSQWPRASLWDRLARSLCLLGVLFRPCTVYLCFVGQKRCR